MLTDTKAFSGFSVTDIDSAKKFYGETLGLKVTDEDMGLIRLHLAGGTEILVYPKPNHEAATYTILNFVVDDIDTTVDQLTARGVEFLKYDGFPQDARGIMRGNGPDIAWFTDPAGNVLSVIKES
ncbi:VOC family protein [Rhodococcus erythropolis]|jgi:predicted enzyme related to lactoylglutathione lyase|uniref:VOC family protein n=1 Tax=Rhodococcus qingshengii TaxID=334542 RepID=UPI000E231DC2|nr:VOC family protein [Rhodococcus qingshengii]MCY4670136.1 VOC family protein [Rhodococcus sp. (in: high G+C Gram-positive bacteria)]MYV27908.1 VOC family protein [Rhodococcus erythropolis]NDK69325.1 VOC family protein [Rhodococcus qingshengii]REK78693.1 VOC family protein [Rhodococcus erythropolis]UGQ54279.1 VOC family protein [Rhodococcus qingshengii]